MAILNPRTGWTNNDGLRVWFGPDEATAGLGGEYNMFGWHWVEFKVPLNIVAGSTTDSYIWSDTVTIPSGAFIERVDVIVTEEAVGANANLTVGLLDQDRTTVIDADGLLAAADVWHDAGAELGILTSYVKGTAEAGSSVGARITNAALVYSIADTAAFTDGTIILKVFYSMNRSTI